ncbi:MAG: AAA family ATPase [Acidimicrobiales bacterium]
MKSLLRSYQQGDDREFHSTAQSIIDDERRKRHDLLADQLEAIMVEPNTKRRPLQVSSLRPLPKTRDELPLLSIRQPTVSFHDLVLPEPLVEVLDAVLDEFRQQSALRAHGVAPRSALLFVGPPGSGKSVTAEALAGELGLAVARVQLPTIVSSYLGETARNLEQIFDFLRTGAWVLLFDEFDMLGRERSDRSDHGELRRVVAAMLQGIEDIGSDSIFVATSNHPNLLDSAVWRRFDEVLEFPIPAPLARVRILELKLRGVRHDVDLKKAAAGMDGFSAAEIEAVCHDAIRLMVRALAKSVSWEHVAYGIKRQEDRRRTINGNSPA